MKKVILTVAMMVSFIAMAQRETKTLASGLNPKWKYQMVIENQTDTMTYFSFTFQNQKYQYISDIGVVSFITQDEVIKFCDAIRELSAKEKGTELTYTVVGIELSVLEFSNSIYIQDRSGKYFSIGKTQAVNFANEIQKHVNILRK
jgi:hypothetical protein